uniref:Uncharacterized protein n=1 Tax=Trichuris muris TaxID=70415 RepID=A0A5S6QM58_TRIMR
MVACQELQDDCDRNARQLVAHRLAASDFNSALNIVRVALSLQQDKHLHLTKDIFLELFGFKPEDHLTSEVNFPCLGLTVAQAAALNFYFEKRNGSFSQPLILHHGDVVFSEADGNIRVIRAVPYTVIGKSNLSSISMSSSSAQFELGVNVEIYRCCVV